MDHTTQNQPGEAGPDPNGIGLCPLCNIIAGDGLLAHLKNQHKGWQLRQWIAQYATAPGELEDERRSYQALEAEFNRQDAERVALRRRLQNLRGLLLDLGAPDTETERLIQCPACGMWFDPADGHDCEETAPQGRPLPNPAPAEALIRVGGAALQLLNALAWYIRNATNPDGETGWGGSITGAQLKQDGPAYKLLAALDGYIADSNGVPF